MTKPTDPATMQESCEGADLEALAYHIADIGHRGQCRRGGDPYIEHPKRVAKNFAGDTDAYCVALLHDALEDTNWTATGMLIAGVPERVVEQVLLLTHQREDSYTEYVRRIRSSPIATRVKIADIVDNLSDDPSGEQKEKYFRALCLLSEVAM